MVTEAKIKEIYQTSEIIWVKTETIMPNRAQPRTVFDAEGLNELAESIKKYGILQPLTVRINPEKSQFSNFQYELIAGERRLRASKLIGLQKVPCVVIESDTKTSAALAIIENLHRKDLGIFEEASAIASLIEIHKLTQEQIASKLSLTQAAVANKLRLLRLTEEEKEVIAANNLTERHARALLRLKNPSMRLAVLNHIVRNNLNVKQSEDYIERKLAPSDDAVKEPSKPKDQSTERKNLINSIKKAIEITRGN